MSEIPKHQVWGQCENDASESQSRTFPIDEEVEFVPESNSYGSSRQSAPPSKGNSKEEREDELRRAMASKWWSVGSKLHLDGTGQCVPCHHFSRNTGCSKGRECNYCHFPHEKKHRPSKAKRRAIRNAIGTLDMDNIDDVEAIFSSAASLASGKYTQTLIQHRMQEKIDEELKRVEAEAPVAAHSSSMEQRLPEEPGPLPPRRGGKGSTTIISL
eukprot:gnl/TRDRNA2_/TRDRNA2_198972_c0_seq1.p2 gnl/TRDRNA2_/TRDRNA2_198972_c0~~gnl/TRDRNA2_/TRDRNA2_198972_c0_seq1.p2  ORF type:complete len:214 (+),score=24.00 gnl/TRDRNA2_/TRDRNA2_198972_c0_seq1:76-717(+)